MTIRVDLLHWTEGKLFGSTNHHRGQIDIQVLLLSLSRTLGYTLLCSETPSCSYALYPRLSQSLLHYLLPRNSFKPHSLVMLQARYRSLRHGPPQVARRRQNKRHKRRRDGGERTCSSRAAKRRLRKKNAFASEWYLVLKAIQRN